ncbi:MAG: ATP-binding protein [Pseudomonadota bacterium]
MASFSPYTVLGAMALYMALLFTVALLVERRTAKGFNPGNHPLVYALSLAVYCTAWTYYGSVGKAASSGMIFLAVYLGPTLGVLCWWAVLRRLIGLKNQYRITSLADLISLRYGRSQSLGALATLVILSGVTPYIALQLKALVLTFKILTQPYADTFLYRFGQSGPAAVGEHLEAIIAGMMILFTIVFGARRLDPTERHQGMIMAVAVESVVKLLAFLAAGVFVTYHLHDGFQDILQRFAGQAHLARLMETGLAGTPAYLEWLSYLVLSMSAVLFLPRQFHVAVVENFDQRHVATAMGVFPLYLLLINLFVVPVAMAGLLGGYPLSEADTFVLRLPLAHGASWLSLLVFLGGFSAATAMIMVATMTMATMAVNHLALPLVQALEPLAFLRRRLLPMRWLAAALIILLGYWFQWEVGWTSILVDMGILSFAAILQLAPAILGGLYWRRGNRAGAFLGLSAGFAVWIYTALLPLFARAGWISPALIQDGPWGLALLAPQRLLGVQDFDPLTNTVFWSLAVNLTLYLAGSLIFRQGQEEERLAGEWATGGPLGGDEPPAGEAFIELAGKLEGFEAILADYLPWERVQAIKEQSLKDLGLAGLQLVTVTQLAELYRLLENTLAGSIGAASAAVALGRFPLFSSQEAQALSAVYAQMLISLRVSPRELKRRIDYYREKEELLRRESELLHHSQRLVREKLQSLDRLAQAIAHEIRNPVTTIGGLAQRLIRQGSANEHDVEYLHKILAGVRSLEKVVSEVRAYADLPAPSLAQEDLGLLLGRVLESYRQRAREGRVDMVLENLAGRPALAWVDAGLIEKALRVLIDNALEAMPQGGRLTLGLASDQDMAVISVSDTGRGISPHDLAYLFDPLFSTKADAVGMNLAIARRIASDHQGDLRVESLPEAGATFLLSLPLEPPESLRLAPQGPPERPPSPK